MAKETSGEKSPATQDSNALAAFVSPRLDLVGPTVTDDIRRAIWRYGAEAVKNAVKEETKAKLGRKREPDWPELKELIESDARDWLEGKDPFATRSNYAIAKLFSERNPGHSVVSTHKRIERKLSRGPYDRRWFTLTSAQILSRDQYPFKAHLRSLEALAKLPPSAGGDIYGAWLTRARATLADYEAKEGGPPSPEMTFEAVDEAVKKNVQRTTYPPLQPSRKVGALAAILADTLKDQS